MYTRRGDVIREEKRLLLYTRREQAREEKNRGYTRRVGTMRVMVTREARRVAFGVRCKRGEKWLYKRREGTMRVIYLVDKKRLAGFPHTRAIRHSVQSKSITITFEYIIIINRSSELSVN